MNAEIAVTPEGFAEIQKETLTKKIEVYPARAWYPSQIGHPCDRFLVWRMTRWQEQAPHDWVLQSIFDEGNLHQPATYKALESFGFDIVREQDRPTQYKLNGNAVISGRPDGKIRGFRGEKFTPMRVLEIKTMQGYAFDKINTVEDLLHADQHYVRGYVDQEYTYEFLENLPLGLIVLKNKQIGLLKAIPVELDFDRAEWLLKRVERLQGFVDKKDDPPPIPYETGICGRCPFLHLCYPPKNYGEGTAIIEDSALIEDLARREQLKAGRDEYEGIDKSVKTRLKKMGVKSALAGPFVIEATERPVKEFTVKARVDTIFEIQRMTTSAAGPAPGGVDPPKGETQAPASPPEAETKQPPAQPVSSAASVGAQPQAETAAPAKPTDDPGVEGARQPLGGTFNRSAMMDHIQALFEDLKLADAKHKAQRDFLWNRFVGLNVKVEEASEEGLRKLTRELEALKAKRGKK
mgnify:FL=1